MARFYPQEQTVLFWRRIVQFQLTMMHCAPLPLPLYPLKKSWPAVVMCSIWHACFVIPQAVVSLIQACIAPDPRHRPTAAQALQQLQAEGG